MNIDELELELRKLPGIRWAAFSELGDRLLVQLHAMEDARSDLALEASRIAARHSDLPIAVDVVRWLAPPGPESAGQQAALRGNGSSSVAGGATPDADPDSAPTPSTPGQEPRLEVLKVVTRPDTDELEVHLSDGATRTVGRAAMSRGLLGAAEATLDGLRGFAPALPVAPGWARSIETAPGGRSLVAVALADPGSEDRYGLSCGDSPMEAAARATLDALHRNLRRARLDEGR
jgi:hypothetical protein